MEKKIIDLVQQRDGLWGRKSKEGGELIEGIELYTPLVSRLLHTGSKSSELYCCCLKLGWSLVYNAPHDFCPYFIVMGVQKNYILI